MQGKSSSLFILAVCEVMAMSLWFSASAVVPSLQLEFSLSEQQASFMTSSVQAGFVCGTIISAILGLADRIAPQRFFMNSALIATIANTSILFIDPTSPMLLVLRFITGMCMAGIYPVGMKMATTWARGDMGLLVGLLVGALTLGSAFPHLFNALGGLEWRITIIASSCASLASALLITRAQTGGEWKKAPPFTQSVALSSFTNPSLRLANLGYIGHMWELYAMWAWLVIFLEASFRLALPEGDAIFWARTSTFLSMGVGGAFGCLIGGYIADRIGRTYLTMGAMAISGTCALFVGSLFGGNPVLLFAVCLVWGISIIADSAQFSASIAELSPPDRVGTMLTVQTSLGFLLTLGTIHVMPVAVEYLGWQYAFSILAIGPYMGVVAMAKLRNQPDATKLAGGRR